MERIVPHEKFKEFQGKYGYIPKSDKDDMHKIRSRMLQGIYRNEKIEGLYCNMLPNEEKYYKKQFMNQNQLYKEVDIQLNDIIRRDRMAGGSKDRLLTNLLSSMPMAFNLFLPLKENQELATKVFSCLFPDLGIEKIKDIKMEYVPGDEGGLVKRKIKIDRSCFDVYIEYIDKKDNKSAIGVEVKYTEPFSQTDFRKETGEKKDRYIKAIEKYDLFAKENTENYLNPKYNQLFRNQLLTREVLDIYKGNEKEKFNNIIQLVIHSNEDTKCIDSLNSFENLLTDKTQFKSKTVETLVELIIQNSSNELKNLYTQIFDRYCNYKLLNQTLANIQPLGKTEKTEFELKEKYHIKLNDVPSIHNWEDVLKFVYTFDGIQHFGSQIKLEKLVKSSQIEYNEERSFRSSFDINDLRAILFGIIKGSNYNTSKKPSGTDKELINALILKIYNIMYSKLWENY